MTGERLRVAVIDLADGPEAQAGASVLACLDPARYERIGVLGDRDEAGAARPGAIDRALLLPPVEDGGFIAALVEAIERVGLDVLLPGSARAARTLARGREPLARAGVAHASPPREALASLEGEGFVSAARSAGLASNRRAVPARRGDRKPFGELESWPVVLVGACGERRIATDAWEAIRGLEVLSPNGGPVVHGPWNPHQVFEVALVVAPSGAPLGAAAVRVLAGDARARPWLAVTVEDRGLVDRAGRFAREAGLSGPLSFLFTRDPGSPSLVDVQPGFPMWIEVVASAGPDLVERTVRLARGEAGATDAACPLVPAGLLFSQTAEDYVVATEPSS